MHCEEVSGESNLPMLPVLLLFTCPVIEIGLYMRFRVTILLRDCD